MAWTKYKEIKYAADGIPSGDLANFPKLISISGDAEIAAECGGGGGIKFTSPDGLTDLPFGLYPSTDLTAGDVLARVKVSPDADASVGDVIARLYYSASESTTEDKAGTVSGYLLFLPLEEDPSGSAPQMLDWVTETNVGTSNGSMTSGDLVAGQVGNNLDMDGSDDVVTVASFAAGSSSDRSLTVSAIVIPNSSGAGSNRPIFRQTGTSWSLYHGADNQWLLNGTIDSGVNITHDARQYVAFFQDEFGVSAQVKLYVNGSLVFNPVSGHVSVSSGDLRIGADAFSQFWHGQIDEFRVSLNERSADWIAYEYTDDFDNANTFTLGTEQGGGGSNNELAGSTSLTFAASGALTGKGALSGDSSLAFSPSATIQAKGRMSGSSSLAFSASGAVKGKGGLAGTSSLTFGPSGTLTGRGSMAGTSSLTFGATGALLQGSGLSGSSSLTFAASGTLRGKGLMSGTSSLTFSVSQSRRAPGTINFVGGRWRRPTATGGQMVRASASGGSLSRPSATGGTFE